jgi:hypothetical protein
MDTEMMFLTGASVDESRKLYGCSAISQRNDRSA